MSLLSSARRRRRSNIRLTGNAQLGAHLAERSDCKTRDNARYPVEAIVGWFTLNIHVVSKLNCNLQIGRAHV